MESGFIHERISQLQININRSREGGTLSQNLGIGDFERNDAEGDEFRMQIVLF